MSSQKKAKRNHTTLWRRLLLALVGLILGVNLYHWNANSLAGNALPMPFGVGAAVVMSGSMEPALSVDDLVIVAEAEEYRVGDVIVYQSGSDLVIHRIIAMDETIVIAQGDANNVADAPIDLAVVKGRMVMAIPFVGTVVRIVKSLPGTLVLVAAAIALMELSWRKEKEKDQDALESIKAEIRQLQKELDETGKGEE